jgi:hypothetical protein
MFHHLVTGTAKQKDSVIDDLVAATDASSTSARASRSRNAQEGVRLAYIPHLHHPSHVIG